MDRIVLRVMFFLGGVSFIGLGYQTITQGGWWSPYDSIYINYDTVKTPVGLLMFIIGIFLVVYTMVGKWAKANPLICPKCGEVIEYPKAKEVSCRACGTKMEKLKGFFERHPELKS
ncbi:MAG TPA: hypothetical protein EYP35_01955 [Desulfobacterales bacterium]|nr:hypothetical protein [Desulfobacterales bacterium]